MKLNMDIEAKDICTKVLDQHPNNEKALFRRGQVIVSVAKLKAYISTSFFFRLT